MFLQGRADLDRGAAEGDAGLPLAAHFDPIHLAAEPLAEPLLQRLGRAADPLRRARQLDLLLVGRQRPGAAVEFAGQLLQLLGQHVGHDVRRADPAGAARLGQEPCPHVGEERLRGHAGAFELGDAVAVAETGQQAALSRPGHELVEQVVERPLRHLQPEVVGRNVFERVAFVEDDDPVVGQHARPGPAQGQVAEEQSVVDDEDLGRVDAAAGFEVEAVGVVRALPAQAIAAVALDEIPHHRRRADRQVALGAIDRPPRPPADLHELVLRRRVGEEGARALLGHAQPALAQVVAPPFDERRPELVREDRLQERDVLAEQLLLQADGVGRDDDAEGLVGLDGLDEGDEVGERLADAGAGLDHEVVLARDGRGDGLGHAALFGSGLEVGPAGGDAAARTQDAVGGHAGHCDVSPRSAKGR